MGETGYLCIVFFFSQLPLVLSLTLPWTIARFLDSFYTFSPAHWRVIRDFTLPSFECISIQFFNLHTHVTDLPDTMPRQRSLTHTHVTYGHHATTEVTLHIPREAEDFPRGDRHFKHAPLPTYLICLSPKCLYW